MTPSRASTRTTAWTAFGGDLHLDLTGRRAAGAGVRAALEDALREAVQDGRLAPGTRLPSSRALGEDLGIARNTVVEAYGQLTAEGWLTSRQGSGTTVAERTTPRPARRAAGQPRGRRTGRFDLMPGRPDVSLFPRSAWLSAARRALATAPHEAFDYGGPLGRIELRQALTDYLARVRGVRTDPDHLLVCAGFSQGLGLLCSALRGARARSLAVEGYGLPPQREIVRAAGLTPAPLPLDGSGARTDLLHGRRDAAVLLTPAHQYPTGVALAAERRAAAVTWAREHDAYVIEDDYDGEFRYDRQPLGAMQALDPERVVYAGTAAKSLAPGLRLAWLALPDALVEPVARLKQLADTMSPVLDQLTLAELITSGTYDRHVRRSRLHYRRRRDRLVAALAERAPHVRVTGIAAGLHAVLQLPPGAPPEAELLARAEAAGLVLSGLTWHLAEPGLAPDAPPALVVGYATPPDRTFPAALDALCELLRER
ncbi:PLP-dependent aminotransferase family protein [Streptomyces sp. CB01881]|uniref:MocR-like pyridoxine biosynthesis transcription factor PdxR n=1 Tax=Streptomyces sp. CB01881 TaxID=2078691 RepID=UPI000CDC26BA|nr:PLP-dependent aminotransferase family protein [Streptomyces sp. CB01881]AUY50383.1 GntR family transcriptional regulator [Streptomyces sp. CB01881]TYC73769.1 PLP-dependent aminotransferase family protein [Streptomyces sp. CB01881]